MKVPEEVMKRLPRNQETDCNGYCDCHKSSGAGEKQREARLQAFNRFFIGLLEFLSQSHGVRSGLTGNGPNRVCPGVNVRPWSSHGTP